MNKILFSQFICLMLLLTQTVAAQNHSRYLHDGWRFRQGNSEIWHPAQVPGCVHLDLMRNHIIEDPFFRMNDRSVQWIDKEDWWYETHFNGTAEEVMAAAQQIVFYGLDTYSVIYLNHQRLGYTDNMHRTYRYMVNGILKKGDNLLEVQFHSAIKRNIPKFDALPYRHNTGPDHSELGGIFNKTISPFARTAGFEYGWDWGSRFVTSGIWRPVELKTWNTARLTDVWHEQRQVNTKRASLTSHVYINATQPIKGAKIAVRANNKVVASTIVNLKQGDNTITLNYNISKPHLWWCNGLGDPYLYDFCTIVESKDKTIDSRHDAIGLRSLEVVNQEDAWGRCLYFKLNGHPVFAKGANMVPNDNFLTRCTDSVYHEVVRSARDVNMNMIRVWGGGVYEDNAFYKYCDQMGIMVWQDFMFACQTYEVDSAFLATVRQEAIDNVSRLRNHACMALYAGNNEAQDIFWGWGNRKADFAKIGQDKRIWQMQRSIFYECLPEVVKEYGGTICYRPSSPYSDPDTCSNGSRGDDHFWGVWHGGEPFDGFYKHPVRFESEYGFQSFPEYESVLRFAPDSADHNIYSDVMMEHQNAGSYANHRIEEYMQHYFKVPTRFKDFLYVGQVLQGDGDKMGMEAFRSQKPYCWGSLVWQINDCWPVASWSTRDYYGRWKAAHYFAKAAYDDILIAPRIMTRDEYEHADDYLKTDGAPEPPHKVVANLPTDSAVRMEAQKNAPTKDKVIRVKMVSDRLAPVKGIFTLKAMTLNGTLVKSISQSVSMKANDCLEVNCWQVDQLLNGHEPGDVIFVMTFTTGGKTYRNIAYPVEQKDMNYGKSNIDCHIMPSTGGYDVTVCSPVFARAVFLKIKGIDNFFSDNYFDLLPKEKRTIHVTTTKDLQTFKSELEVMTIGDTI